jgi:hypothetical protein
VLSDLLQTPNTGTGIYQREGWSAGDSRVLDIVLTGSAGMKWPTKYNLKWVGNDGTFHSAGSVWLEQNVPVTLPVAVAPQTAGVHSAILNLSDAAGDSLDYQILNTVVAAEQAGPANGWVVTFDASIDRPEKSTFFVSVPENASSIAVDFKATIGTGRVWVFSPEGIPIYNSSYTSDKTSIKLPSSIIIPGVWEYIVETSPSSVGTPAVFSTKVTLQGASISPTVWTIDSAIPGTPYINTFTITNELGPFTGGASSSMLSGNFGSRPTLVPDQPLSYDFTVPSGSSLIGAKLSNPSDSSAIVDMYLYDCTAGIENCKLNKSGYNSGGSSNGITVITTKEGRWRVMLVPRSIPSGSTEIDYTASIMNSGYGSLQFYDPSRLHPSGEIWTVKATVTPRIAPDPGWSLRGTVYVGESSAYLTGTGIASAEIDINFQ